MSCVQGCGAGDEGVEVEGFGEFGEDAVQHVVFVGFEGQELLFAGDDYLGGGGGVSVGSRKRNRGFGWIHLRWRIGRLKRQLRW